MKTKFYVLILSLLIFTINLSSCDIIKTNENTQDEITDSLNSDSSEPSEILNEQKIKETEIKKEIITKDGQTDKPIEVANEFIPDPTLGKETFDNTCASCHGISGMGDGVAAVGLRTKPRNLGDSEYVSNLSDDHLYKVINEGGAAAGLSALMPPWNGILTDEDIKNIISHIRTNLCKCNTTKPENTNLDQ